MSGVPASEAKKIANRLRRAQGQLGAVLSMVEEERDCRDILPRRSSERGMPDAAVSPRVEVGSKRGRSGVRRSKPG